MTSIPFYGTSTQYTFSCTRDDIIRQAMLTIGKLGENENPTQQSNTDCAFQLNMIVKQWMGKQDFAPGLKMWTNQRGYLILSSTKRRYLVGPTGDNWTNQYSVTTTTAAAALNASTIQTATSGVILPNDTVVIQLSTGDTQTTTAQAVSGTTVTLNNPLTAAVSSGAQVWNYTYKAVRPLEILAAVLRDSNGYDIPLNFMTLQDYEFLPNKANPQNVSDPTAIYYEPQLGNGFLYIDFYGAQDVTKHIQTVYTAPVGDFISATDVPNFPQEWFAALVDGLSKRIAPMFNSPWTPEMEDNRKTSMAMAQESNAGANRSTLYFQPGNE